MIGILCESSLTVSLVHKPDWCPLVASCQRQMFDRDACGQLEVKRIHRTLFRKCADDFQANEKFSFIRILCVLSSQKSKTKLILKIFIFSTRCCLEVGVGVRGSGEHFSVIEKWARIHLTSSLGCVFFIPNKTDN